jgi:hypothetical protein
MPCLTFFMDTLQAAVQTDPFWGKGYWEHNYMRGEQLCAGLMDLRDQSFELETLVLSPATSPIRSRAHPFSEGNKSNINLKKGTIAKRQSTLLKEEQAMVRRLAFQCWSITALPQDVRKAIVNSRTERRRSLTCP